MILALVGCGEAPADWAGDWASTGERLGMGVGCAWVFVEGKMCAFAATSFFDEELLAESMR